MTKVHCSVPERYVNPLFEVFDGGDFVLSSWHDIEEEETQMQVYLAGRQGADDASRRLREALAVVGCEANVEVSEVPDEDWKLAYRRHFRTEPIGRRLVTVPTWEFDAFKASDDFRGRIPIVLDPGMAFGTGKHETTRACLEYIDEIAGDSAASAGAAGAQAPAPQARRHLAPSFLDMGCGSGILSIAAAKLGFSPVAGFDIDEDAVGASRENAALNGVDVDYALFALGKGSLTLDESIEAAKGLYPDLQLNLSQRSQPPGTSASQPPRPFAPSDVVVANILGPLLISFAGEIASYARKTLIVSGILSDLYPEVLAAFESRGFGEVSRKTIGEWTTGHLVRRGGVRG